MAINPDNITTIRVDQLAPATLDLTKLVPIAEVNGELKQSTIQDLADLIATTISASGGVGFLPLVVTNGQQLPDVPENPSFFLCGAGTYLNINGYPDVICTEALNAVVSLTDHWQLAVEIPIVAEVGVQTVTGSAVDNTDPLNPVINEIIDGVQTIVAGTNITVDNTDPSNPIISASGGYGSQNLQQVTDEGATTTNGIISYNGFYFQGASGQYISIFGEGFFLNTSGVGFNHLDLRSDNLTAERAQQVQDKDGTFAYLDDIPSSSTFVPYTGATQDVNLGEFGLLTGNIEFDNTPTNLPTAAGSMYYNDTDGTVDLILKGGNVKLQLGQESVLRVVNKTATNINLLEANYQAVRVTGAQGQRLKVDLAQATTDTLSAETIGLVTETINNNQEGFITTSGLVRNINTTGSLQGETWADGDILYLSPTTAGNITKVKPTAPNHLVIIGYVVSSHATQGSIFVKVDNGYELDELHNVKITTATNNQALTYTSATDIWENKTIIEDSITDGVTDKAPSQNAVFDALALKQTDLFEFDTKQGFYLFEDFLGDGDQNSFATGYGFMPNASGAGAVCSPTITYPNRTNQQGVIQLSTGTTATGSSNIRLGDNNAGTLYLGQGIFTMQYFVNIETLSDATNRFYSIIGANTGSNLANTNGIFFIYDEGGVGNYGTASANWKCITRNSTTTSTITSTAVTASQWYVLRIVINANASSIEFFINGTSVATHTTNIPTLVTPRIAQVKTVGMTNRNIFCDYMVVRQIYTTPRTI